jgi:hypothetical protein
VTRDPSALPTKFPFDMFTSSVAPQDRDLLYVINYYYTYTVEAHTICS